MTEPSRGKIMIVEDERIVALDLRSKLKDFGFEVSASVPSGEKAMEAVAEERPDCILMDIMLEGEMDGIETTRRIKENQDIPVVYVSAYTDEPTRSRAMETAPSGFLSKPVETSELKDTLARILQAK